MSFRYGPGFLAALLTIANVLIPLAVFTFATGFFPYKPVLPGLAQYEALEYGPPPQAPFDRLIFMVVDALRSDFVYLNDTGFTYTQELIRDGAALPFTAYARSPTVTMPRIKAITTGSIPSFLDVILNLDEADSSSTLAAQDTWLAQMKAKETGKMLMYGDDTWLKLFPGTFDRADGTASFFVADFTEVDNNVTRHIDSELKNDDWSTLVLHYLGLDHIGHKSGPRSSHMVPKQHEMDGIVKRIYNAMESREHMSNTLMVLCGDHGMNDAGNHGASSPGETSPALVFISPKLKALQRNLQAPVPFREDFSYYTKIEQSDLAPTLGALLGFPVPQNNLGAFISDFLPFWPDKNDQIQLLVRNARQILNIVTVTFGSEMFDLGSTFDQKTCSNPRDDAQELACEWHRINDALKAMDGEAELDPTWREAMSKWLSRAQDLMSSMASNYDMGRLHIGEAVVGIVAGSLIFGARLSLIPLLAISVTYGVMMFASSYVEEEHHFWYWATSAWLGSMGIKKMQSTRSPSGTLASILIALTATRLIRGWNQTGQKHAGEPDIAKTFIATRPPILWTLVSVTYLFLFVQLLRKLRGLPRAAVTAASALLVLSASIVSPLGVVALISNCIIAPILFNEKFRRRDFGGVVIAVAGVVVVVLSAKQEETKLDPDDVWDAITTLAFEIYLAVTISLIVILMWASPRYGHRTILIDLGLVGLFGGFTALSTKGLSSILSTTLLAAFKTPVAWALIFILLFTAVMQVRYVNKSLQRFSSTQVIPIQFVLFTLSVIIGSAVLYRDFERTSAEQAGKFVGGCLLTFFGVFLITSGRVEEDMDDGMSDVDGVEETIGLAEQDGYSPTQPLAPSSTSIPSSISRRSSRASNGNNVNNGSKPFSLQRDSGIPTLRVPTAASVGNITGAESEPLLANPWSNSATEEILPPPGVRTISDESIHTFPGFGFSPSEPTTPYYDGQIQPRYPTNPTDRPVTPRTSLPPRPHSHNYPGPLFSPSPLSSTVSAVVKDTLLRNAESPLLRRPSVRRLRSSIRASLFMPEDNGEGADVDAERQNLVSRGDDQDGGVAERSRTAGEGASREQVTGRQRSLSDTLGDFFRVKKKRRDGGTDPEEEV